jgi:hypothetical protein
MLLYNTLIPTGSTSAFILHGLRAKLSSSLQAQSRDLIHDTIDFRSRGINELEQIVEAGVSWWLAR